MKELLFTYYKSLRKNSNGIIKEYAVYCNKGFKRPVKTMLTKYDFYDTMDRISFYKSFDRPYISIKMDNYTDAHFFSPNDVLRSRHNILFIPESKRYNANVLSELIELVTLVYHYFILIGCNFSYDYNPFIDPNVLFHLPELKGVVNYETT